MKHVRWEVDVAITHDLTRMRDVVVSRDDVIILDDILGSGDVIVLGDIIHYDAIVLENVCVCVWCSELFRSITVSLFQRVHISILLLTCSLVEERCSCDSNSQSAGREIPCPLWDPWFHYSVHKSQPLDPVLVQMNLVHILVLYWYVNCRVPFHLRLDELERPFLLAFPTKLYTNPHAAPPNNNNNNNGYREFYNGTWTDTLWDSVTT
jgi:hypothetical protein